MQSEAKMRGVRPTEEQQVTLLFESAGRPVTRITHVRQVLADGLVLARVERGLEGQTNGSDVAVIFVQGDRLYRWPMRLQESLPASYFLASLKEPGEGERREFVRAGVSLYLSLSSSKIKSPFFVQGDVDLSASGFRIDLEHELPVGRELDVEIRREPNERPVCARARVVRAIPGGLKKGLACEFLQMGSADEARLVELIFDARTHALNRRMQGG